MMPLVLGGVGLAAVLLLCLGGGGIATLVWWRVNRPADEQAKANHDANTNEKPVHVKLAQASLKIVWTRERDRHILQFSHSQPHDLRNIKGKLTYFQSGHNTNANEDINWGVWSPNTPKKREIQFREGATKIRLVAQAEGLTKMQTYELDCLIPDPPPLPPPSATLTAAHLAYNWTRERESNSAVLMFKHIQPFQLNEVVMTMSWFDTSANVKREKHYRKDVWFRSEEVRFAVPLSAMAKNVRLVGEAEFPDRARVAINIAFPDAPSPQEKPTPPPVKLTAANIKASWSRDGDRHVLTFNHGQAFELKNVKITVHWFQAAFNTEASQGRTYPVWSANQNQQQIMPVRDWPTRIRIVGQGIGPNDSVYQFDCAIPDPP